MQSLSTHVFVYSQTSNTTRTIKRWKYVNTLTIRTSLLNITSKLVFFCFIHRKNIRLTKCSPRSMLSFKIVRIFRVCLAPIPDNQIEFNEQKSVHSIKCYYILIRITSVTHQFKLRLFLTFKFFLPNGYN